MGKDSSVIYFYFDFQMREKQLVQHLLSSMVVQLNRNDQTFKVLEAFYDSHSRGSMRPTLQDLRSVIRQMIDRSSRVFLVIDALDECEDRKVLLESLEYLRSWNQGNIHTLVTSRRETDIEASVAFIATEDISLEESVVQGDILCFVQHQLLHDAKLSRWPESVREEIQSALLAGAQGMFRWVECQIYAIRGCMKLDLLRKTLKSLPKTLDDTYTRMLSSIPEEYVEDARRILSCLICSFHPLGIEEIADTVAITAHGETFYDVDTRLLDPRDILTICSGLVTTARSVRPTFLGFQHHPIEELRLAHFSVKEYLVSNRKTSLKPLAFHLDERHAHDILANLCMRYLSRCHEEKMCEEPNFLQQYAVLRMKRVPFAPYAASSWSRHFRAAQLDNQSPLLRQCLDMLTDPLFLLDVIRLHPPWFRYEELRFMQQCGYVKQINGNSTLHPAIDPVPPLYFASLLGVDQLVLMLIELGENVNDFCWQGTCLVAAVCGGHQSTVQLLLENGAEVNARALLMSGEEEILHTKTAIHEAVYGWDEDLIKLLLAWGGDVNIRRSSPGKIGKKCRDDAPLETAARRSQKRFIRLLIDAGAEVNTCAGSYESPLELVSGDAIRPDSVEIMTMLLDAGADPDLTADPSGLRTPLFNAIDGRNTEGVRLLLERGANREAIEALIVPHLLRYSFRWETKFEFTVGTLVRLRHVVPVDLPLVAGSKYGFTRTIDYMLRHGAPPDSQEKGGATALQAAAFTPSNTETVKLLIDAGANVNTTGGPFGSALQTAALSGKAEVVRILLEKGASVNHAEGEYGTALQISRKRLEDQMASCPGIWKYGDSIERYGPSGYYSGDSYPPDADEYSMRGPSRNGDYEAKINILHPSDADYQGVIDLLLSYGAMDV